MLSKTNPAERGTKLHAIKRQNSRPQWVVGIGASAGGVRAVTQLLEHVPADTGIAFIIFQHFDPIRKSVLPDLLANITSMPVKKVTNGTRVRANCVYVIPHNANTTIAKNVLTLSSRPKTALRRHPIDEFLRSLAEDKHDRAIGIILSGIGSDGTLGLQAIKAKGGITFAQNEKSARYTEMPRKAIKAGCVDFMLTPAQIADEVVRLAREQPRHEESKLEPSKPEGIEGAVIAMVDIPRRESQERAKWMLVEQMLVGIAQCDASGKFTMVNQRYCDITGRSKFELLNMRICDVTDPDDWPSTAELYRRLFETGESFFIEKRYRHKDRSEIWVHAHVSAIRNAQDKIEESVAIVIDVTSRKRAQEELAAAKDRLAADLDAMTRLQKISATFVREGGLPPLPEIVEAAVAIARAGKADMRLFDATSEKLTIVAQRGFEPSFLAFWNTEQSTGPYSAALKCGQPLIVENVTVSPSFLCTPELDVMLQAGVMGLQAMPVLSRSGKLLAVLTVYYETPGRPDERTFQALDLLARQAGDIIEYARSEADLRSAYEQAEAATRAKDELLAVVSHELRGPLTSVLGYARLLHREIKGQAEHFVDVIERNAQAQLQLIEDLLDTARIIRGKLKLEVQPVNPADVIRAALEVARPAAQVKDIQLRDLLDPFAGQITGDPARLQQVLWNLLSNAIKFTPNGGHVEVTLGRPEHLVEIVVRDTGIGIDPDFLPYVFERFRQSDMSSTRRVGGLGLGLSLVKHLVELHGGSVDAKSERQGAIFSVRLPVRAVYTAPSRESSVNMTPASTAKPLNGVRALIVDDEQEVCTLVTLTLESFGAKPEAVSSAKEAVERLLRHEPDERFDVLIADIAMPKEDGYALLRKIRALLPENNGNIPAVALTGYANSDHRMRALEAGFQTYLVKPVDPDELVVAIQGLIKSIDQGRIAEA